MSRIQTAVRPLFTLYPRVIALIWLANGWRLIAAAILALVGALSGPVQIWISAVVINQIVSVVQGGVTQASLSGVLAPLAERDIYQCFAQLMAGKMTVLISHRLASCKMAHRILVLEHGKIIEEGSHGTRMTRGGRYAEMFTAQAEQYLRSPTV
jgi:hypothetical protein